MNFPALQIGNMTAKVPIVQGGMGVRISLSSLASAVANEGGIGTISSIGLGDTDIPAKEYEETSRKAFAEEIRKAKSMTNGHLAVNIMGVLSNADDLVTTAVAEGIKMVVFGAGLPTKLPRLVPDPEVNLVPIISSGRGAQLILRSWDKRYSRIPNAFILEGPLAGGHLGFSHDQLDNIDDFTLESLLSDLLEAVKPYEDQYGRKVPIIAGGGVYTGKDIAKMLSLGASGVQMGTRFVATNECDASMEFKQAFINAKKEDIVITKSPVGLPGRAIRNDFLKMVEERGKLKIKCNFRCLSTCKIEEAKYCIANALLSSWSGDVDHGLIFCGQNAYRVNQILSVKELMAELTEELEKEFSLKREAA
jgi:nitronate monooxygenase